MAEKNIKVYNRGGSSFGIVTANGIPKNIKDGSFILLTEDDVQLIASTSKAFTKGYLFVEEDKTEVLEEVGIAPEENTYITDEELEKILKGGKRKDFDDFVSGFDVSDIQMRNRIIKTAKKADIANSRIDFIEESFGISFEDFSD